jgi:hypothetical protein
VIQQPGRLSLVVSTTFERTSGGYLDQQYISESFDFVLNPEGLTTQLVTQTTQHFGDQDLSTGGADENVAVGVLQKVSGGRQDLESGQFAKIKQEMQDLSALQKRLSQELEVLDKEARDAIQFIKEDSSPDSLGNTQIEKQHPVQSDCESKYRFHEDRMCYCYGVCG